MLEFKLDELKDEFTNDFSPLSERRQGVIALSLIQASGSLRAVTARISQTLSRIWSLAVPLGWQNMIIPPLYESGLVQCIN